MISNSPMIRAILYGAAIVSQVGAFFTNAADPGALAGAMQDTANFLGAMAGMTALGNLSVAPKVLPKEEEKSA